MDNEIARENDPVERKAGMTRAMAGKALAVFAVLMIALTWASRMLEAMTIATVSTASVQRGALEIQARQSGVLEAAETVPVLVQESARVLDVYVKAGAEVTADEALFCLDYSDIVKTADDKAKSARQNADRKQRALDWAAADLGISTVNRIMQRMDNVALLETAFREAEEACAAGDSAENRNRLTHAKTAYETEKRFLDTDVQARDYRTKLDDALQAEAEWALLADEYLALIGELDSQRSGSDCTKTLYAPVSGTVLEMHVSKGSIASQNTPAMTLSNRNSGVLLTVAVDEEDAGNMAVGDVARIIIAGERYDGGIASIVLAKDRQGVAYVAFQLPDGDYAPGMSAEMIFTARTQNYDVIIPRSALRHDSNGSFVYAIQQVEGALGARMSVRRVDVYVLDQDSNRAAVQGGLTQRDVVVVRSDRSLSDGDRVRLAES